MVRIALGQLNTTVGDLDGNVARMADGRGPRHRSRRRRRRFPELAITGYPPEDLVLRRAFVERQPRCPARPGEARPPTACPVVVPGSSTAPTEGSTTRRRVLRRAVASRPLSQDQAPELRRVRRAPLLRRPAPRAPSSRAAEHAVGLSVCEDAWHAGDPFARLRRASRSIVNINGSPYHRGKLAERVDICAARARADRRLDRVRERGGRPGRAGLRRRQHGGGPRRRGRVPGAAHVRRGPAARRSARRATSFADARPPWPEPDDAEEVYRALCSASATTCARTGSTRPCSGLSGGIDSALVAVLAVDALGPDAVRGLAMPSPYSSSRERRRCGRLRRAARDPPRPGRGSTSVLEAYRDAARRLLRRAAVGVAEENLQARIRGNLLMAVSNRFGSMVLATGNKSEYAVGYSTLYGDMAGGFAPIKDVPKTLVYELAGGGTRRPRTRRDAADPRARDRKPPSAELRPDQKDTDSLPPVRGARPDHRGLRRRRSESTTSSRSGVDRELVERVDRDDRPRRVQAPTGGAGREDHPQSVRPRPPPADHEPLPRADRERIPCPTQGR